jgi:hypothetical protein
LTIKEKPVDSPPLKRNCMKICGPGGIRTRGLFSAIEEQVGEKRKKAVHYVYYVTKSPYCASISVPELYPQYEARKGDP